MDQPFTEPQEQRIKELMLECTTSALDDYFVKKGKTAKGIVVAVATVIGSLTVIFGGLKFVAGWLGFTYIGK